MDELKLDKLRTCNSMNCENKDTKIILEVNGKKLTKTDLENINEILSKHKEEMENENNLKKEIKDIFSEFLFNRPMYFVEKVSKEEQWKDFSEYVLEVLKEELGVCKTCGR